MTAPCTARLILPRRSLASCVRAYVVRDTTGLPPLPAGQRFNHFPATTLCSLNWFIEGRAQMLLENRGVLGPLQDPLLFRGPQTRPTISHNPGPVRAFKLLLFPQALHALTGMPIAAFVDRIVPLASALDGAWLTLADAVLQSNDDESRVALIEDFLEPRWHAARHRGGVPAGKVGDWTQALLLQAATSGWGRSARSVERRVRLWAGQPLRRLKRLVRAEASWRLRRADGPSAGWADFAQGAGYADQAHLCREVRDITGHSPAELWAKAQHDERYWAYRIWG
ncbi:helix-turn-helix domain-containing protein [Ideonella sp. BN130291]|uniref:helix-turn-helix domain-containing protein n=1 Tax=Ideonella sp. BN130291 TaxID=3112940 RepID=UPI002E25E29D|nr:helix-turn-helix domain-containing protein [Ideonella sp. BN130291]